MAHGSRLDVAIVGLRLRPRRWRPCGQGAPVVLMEKAALGTEKERGAVVARVLNVRRALLADAHAAH